MNIKEKILKEAKEDLPLYCKDLQHFWGLSIDNICDDDLYQLYRGTLVFKNWKHIIEVIEITECNLMLDEVFEDINTAFLLALMGRYRSSYINLRSSLELSFQFLYFIHHPIEYKKWQTQGSTELKMKFLETYLLEHPHFSAANIQDANIREKTKKIITESKKLWGHSSKYIHGESPKFFHTVKNSTEFSLERFNIWKTDFLKVTTNLNHLFVFFFKKDLHKMPDGSLKILIDSYNINISSTTESD